MDANPPQMAPAGREEPPAAELSESGVDLSLIRWMLSLTPSQRLDVLQDFVDSVSELRRGESS